jgi:hypothetical protein
MQTSQRPGGNGGVGAIILIYSVSAPSSMLLMFMAG